MEFEGIKEKAYLERTPEAQHAILLFRKYSTMVKEQQRYDAGEGTGTPSGGFWDPDLSMKHPMKQVRILMCAYVYISGCTHCSNCYLWHYLCESTYTYDLSFCSSHSNPQIPHIPPPTHITISLYHYLL